MIAANRHMHAGRLLRDWQRGSAPAGDELARTHLTELRGFFARQAPEVADDLTQQAFLHCLRSLPRIDADRSFRNYLFGVARHVLLDHRRGTRSVALTSDHPSALEWGRDPLDGESVLDHAQRSEFLRELVERVPERYRRCIRMFYWEDMSVRQIASAEGVSEGTVKSRLSRGRAHIESRYVRSAKASRVSERRAGTRHDEQPVELP